MIENNDASVPLSGERTVAPRWQRLAHYAGRTWLQCAVLVVLGFVVRLPALQGEFIWDDPFLARDNPFIRSPLLIVEAFRHYLLLDSFSLHYRPVQNISYMLDYFVWNTNTYGFHLSNVLWHVGSAVLLFLLVKRLLPGLFGRAGNSQLSPRRCTAAAFLIALFWAIHPVHSAAVDYISGRADSLAFFFAAASWLLFFRAADSRGRAWRIAFYSGAAICALLALCSRESACMWLVVFLLHLFAFDCARPLRAKLALLAACLAIVAAYGALRHLPERRSAPSPTNGWSAPVRGVLMLRALGDYTRLMLFPDNLHMERTVVNSEAMQSDRDWRRTIASEYLTLAGLVVAAGLIAGATCRGRARRLRCFGVCWFVLAYLPVSNLVDLNATSAEHWLYLPSVGFILFVAGCYLELPRRAGRVSATVAACLAIVALGARSYVRSSDWVTNETFYRRTVAAGGGSIRVILNLGQIYATQEKYAQAESLFRKALQLSPTYLIARNNLADVLRREGKIEEADRLLSEAVSAATEARKELPRTWLAALHLAKVREENGDPAGALEILAQARRDYPDVWRLICSESELLRKTVGPDAALASVQQFARANWWHVEAALALGKLYAEKGDVAAALASLRHASRLDVHNVSALNLIAMLNVNQRRFDEAYRAQRRAIARQPDEPRQYLILSDILQKMGRSDEASALIAQVSRMHALAQEHEQLALN